MSAVEKAFQRHECILQNLRQSQNFYSAVPRKRDQTVTPHIRAIQDNQPKDFLYWFLKNEKKRQGSMPVQALITEGFFVLFFSIAIESISVKILLVGGEKSKLKTSVSAEI